MASPTPNDLTRQQLDELDTLLQRMLALPLTQPEPAVAFSPPPPLPELPPPAPRPAPRMAPEPVAARAMPQPAFAPSFLPFPAAKREERPAPPLYPDPTPAVEFVPAGTLRGVDAPALPYDFHRGDPNPTPTHYPSVVDLPDVNPFADSAPTPPPPAPPAVTDRRPVPVFLWPVFAANWLMEFALGWFGPVGALLTRPAMKMALGWLGVVLAVGAGVWAARGMGWLPWPR